MSPVAVRRGYRQAIDVLTVAVRRRGSRRGPSRLSQVLVIPTVAVPVAVVRQTPHTPQPLALPFKGKRGGDNQLAKRNLNHVDQYGKSYRIEDRALKPRPGRVRAH